MADVLTTSALTIPGTSLGIVVERASTSVLAKLSPEKPTLFGPVKGATFTDTPRAQVLGEGEAKRSTAPGLTPWSADPIKMQTSVRVSSEFLWADEDYRLGVINDAVAPAIGLSISRGVDLLAIHGINPATGEATTKMPKHLSQTTNVVDAAGKPTAEVVAATGLVLAGHGAPSGVALDGAYGFSLATEVNPATGVELNPGLGFGQNISTFKGLSAATGTTVSGVPEISDTGIRALVGDFSAVRWGFQRQIPMELLRYGNPDNMVNSDGTPRDLAGHNEVLLRVEAVVYIAIGDLNRFAVVKGAPITGAPGAQ